MLRSHTELGNEEEFIRVIGVIRGSFGLVVLGWRSIGRPASIAAMNALPHIAILGLYNSGSTALVGALHRLGVHMGAPFWYSSDERARNNYYEPWDLACQLRFWWSEPGIRENTHRQIRISCLAHWVRLRQCFYQSAVGAKHPLLCLCGDDLVTAWGADTIFLRSCRPVEESIERLRARNWFPQHGEALQRRLWQALEEFCSRQPHFPVAYRQLRSEPAAALREIAAYAHLTPTASQFAAAEASIDRA